MWLLQTNIANFFFERWSDAPIRSEFVFYGRPLQNFFLSSVGLCFDGEIWHWSWWYYIFSALLFYENNVLFLLLKGDFSSFFVTTTVSTWHDVDLSSMLPEVGLLLIWPMVQSSNSHLDVTAFGIPSAQLTGTSKKQSYSFFLSFFFCFFFIYFSFFLLSSQNYSFYPQIWNKIFLNDGPSKL